MAPTLSHRLKHMFGISAPGTRRSYDTKRFDKPQPDESATDEKSKAH